MITLSFIYRFIENVEYKKNVVYEDVISILKRFLSIIMLA